MMWIVLILLFIILWTHSIFNSLFTIAVEPLFGKVFHLRIISISILPSLATSIWINLVLGESKRLYVSLQSSLWNSLQMVAEFMSITISFTTNGNVVLKKRSFLVPSTLILIVWLSGSTPFLDYIPITIEYYHVTGKHQLTLMIAPPNSYEFTVVPSSRLFHAPSSEFTYTYSKSTYYINEEIPTNTPIYHTIIAPAIIDVQFTISPALPQGLSMDSATGIIRGIPTVTSSLIHYTVTMKILSTNKVYTASVAFSVIGIPFFRLKVMKNSLFCSYQLVLHARNDCRDRSNLPILCHHSYGL